MKMLGEAVLHVTEKMEKKKKTPYGEIIAFICLYICSVHLIILDPGLHHKYGKWGHMVFLGICLYKAHYTGSALVFQTTELIFLCI